MVFVFLALGVLIVSGVGTYFYLQEDEVFDIVSDFKEIKAALRAFRNENKGLTKGIEYLKPYLESGAQVKLDHYTMSIDDKFLIVNKIPKGVDPNSIAKIIGGKSKYSEHKLKLSFFTIANSAEPQAVIRIQPIGNYTTTTKIEYSSSESIVDENNILKEEWENNEEYFDEEGVHTIKLRVMDKHFRWSEWESLDIFVSESTGIKHICADGGHLMVVHNNGKVDAFGDNTFGQLGNCTNKNNVKVEPLMQVDRVEAVATGDNHTLFLKSDKKVFATGKNDFGQLGIGNRNNSKIPKLTWGIENVIQVAAGNGFSAAVTTEGLVYMWGQNESQCLGGSESHFVDRPFRLEGLDSVKQVSLGQNYTMALKYDGTVTAWGENNYGELGLGYKSKFNEPTVTLFKEIRQIVASKGFTLAVTKQDRILAVGHNNNCQLGFEGEKFLYFPQEIPSLKDIEKVASSGDFSLALTKTGRVYAWGQFSPIEMDFALTPYLSEELTYIKDIAAMNHKGYAIGEDDSIYEFGSKFNGLRKLELATVGVVDED